LTSLVFAGTPAFAAAALTCLLAAGARGAPFEVRAVFTQPDRPAGRGQRPLPSPVKRLALAHGLPVYQPVTLRDPEAQQTLARLEPDYLVVAAYGLILPPAVLAMARVAPLNIHASLLPRWRGAAPIVRAVEHGDARTGICIMRMEAGLDTGPVCLRREIAIEADDTAGTLHDRLATLGAEAIVGALRGLEAGTLVFEPQSGIGVTYARKVEKAEAVVDWRRPAIEVAARLRAFDPIPGSSGRLESAPDVPLRLFRPRIVDQARTGATGRPTGAPTSAPVRNPGAAPGAPMPGQLLDVSGEGVVVACGNRAVSIGELQRPGGRRLPVAAFLAGHRLAVGDRFLPGAGAGAVQPVETVS
jgi:methionyl-tRNA formyltransferase